MKHFGIHGIRNLFASILASKNVPLVEIQKMLRHGSIQTTARYIHTLQEKSREALEALPKLEDRSDRKAKQQRCSKNKQPTNNPHLEA
ncbi:MAG: tyrosine-type recombinase/integrase [Desulfocapsaceae bacterium]|nr:tyrosine-type recombinase/integrase [Desulfocapsaceae bacterium]